ncbi:unnamed protein product [marine sediment metagenome]|uniref:Uncharacterized protein n=1 Tax=marine sediment metagenome TaxID=412755 RepID=X1LAZ6_9ZZZZ
MKIKVGRTHRVAAENSSPHAIVIVATNVVAATGIVLALSPVRIKAAGNSFQDIITHIIDVAKRPGLATGNII